MKLIEILNIPKKSIFEFSKARCKVATAPTHSLRNNNNERTEAVIWDGMIIIDYPEKCKTRHNNFCMALLKYLKKKINRLTNQ